MGLQELLTQLSQRNIRLQLNGDKLRCLAPPGQLSKLLSQAISEHKPALMELLAEQASRSTPKDANPAPQAEQSVGQTHAKSLLKPAPAGVRLPLSYAQERLWFWDQLRGPNAIYNIPIAIPLMQQALDVPALKSSCQLLLQRHQVLRTVFRQQDGELFQQVLPCDEQAFEFKQCELSRQYSEDERDARDAEIRQLLEQQTQRPFDLSQGPLFRLLVISLDPRQHIVFIGLHHIVCDGWSNLIILRELTAHYRALSSGQPPITTNLTLQYGDYAYWQRQQFAPHQDQQSNQKPDATRQALAHPQLQYWCRQLAGLPPVLELPYDYPRPALQSHEGQSLAFELDPKLSAQLKQLALSQGVSLFMLLLAVFYLMLERYSQRSDLVVGSPLSQRHHPMLEEMVGPFINTVALRVQLDNQQSFSEFLQQVRDVVLAAFEHQDVPFEQVVNALQLPRSLAHEPLVQVNFLLKAAPVGELLQKDAETLDEQFGFNIRQVATYARSDLIVMTKEEGDRIVGWFEYSTELFAEDRIRQMMVHYQTLLRSVATSPQARILDLAMLNVHELGLLRRWSGRDQQPVLPADIMVQWQRCVAKYPQRLAILGGRQDYSFAQLDELSTRIAALWLRDYGLLPGRRVALRLQNQEAQVLCILAALKLAATYIPLNSMEAPLRLQQILEELDAELVVDDEDYQQDYQQALALSAQDLDAFQQQVTSHNALANESANSDSAAYIIYTSGSTGQAKGVMVTRSNVNHFCAARDQYLKALLAKPAQAGQPSAHHWRWAWNVAYSFDMSWQGLAALMYGSTLVLTAPEIRRDPVQLQAWINQHQVNAIDLTPSQMRVLFSIDAVPDVQLLVLGGEGIDAELWQQLATWQDDRSANEQRWVLNAYGPTEATVNTSIAHIAAHEASHIGRPLRGWYCYVLDEHGRLVAPGVPGELYIGGVGVAAAYWQRLDITAERFISDNWSGGFGQRLYRTGDRVCWMNDGQLNYLGRMDHQMKVRAYRVEPAEVEQALSQLTEIDHAAVACDDDHLLAFVCLRPGESLKPNSWHEQLAQHLPDYMIPDRWVLLAELPRNRHGKLDRKALLQQLSEGKENHQAEGKSSPLTAMEQQLSAIWAELLPAQGFRAESHFFAEGGHSLLLMRLMHAITVNFGVQLTVKALFEHPQLSEQAAFIEAAQLQQAVAVEMEASATKDETASKDDDDNDRDRLLI